MVFILTCKLSEKLREIENIEKSDRACPTFSREISSKIAKRF